MYFGARLSPLPPIGHAHATSDPMIQFHATLIAAGDTKVVDPAPKLLAELEPLVAHRYAPVAVGQLPHSAFQPLLRFRMPMHAAAAEGKAEKLAIADLDHLTFVAIDHQLETLLQITAQTMQDALTRALTTQHDDDVVRITGKAMPAPSNKGFALDLNKSVDVSILHCSLSNNTSGFADISEQSQMLIFNCSLSGEGRFKMRDRCYLRHNIKQGFISAIFSSLFDTDLTSRHEEILDLPT